jgi:hypothetical protein
MTSQNVYSKEFLKGEIVKHVSPADESSIAKGLDIDYLYDFKKHFSGLFRIVYRGGSDYINRYKRSPYYCLQKYAKTFTIYPRSDNSFHRAISAWEEK